VLSRTRLSNGAAADCGSTSGLWFIFTVAELFGVSLRIAEVAYASHFRETETFLHRAEDIVMFVVHVNHKTARASGAYDA
jgi:hypothetical protein